MANVGDHPNIVNLIGACSRGGKSAKPPLFKYTMTTKCNFRRFVIKVM